MSRILLVVLAASQQRSNEVAAARGLRRDQVRWARHVTDLDVAARSQWLVDWSLDTHPEAEQFREAIAQRLTNDTDPQRSQSRSVHR